MKHNIFYSVFLFCLALMGCSSDEAEVKGDLPVLYANKSLVNLWENNTIVFSVDYLNIDFPDASGFIIKNETTGEILEENVYTFTEEAVYEFTATHNTTKATSKVLQVRAAKPVKSDIYYRNNLLFDFTGTWCTACPGMISGIKLAKREYPDRMIAVEVHNNDELSSKASKAIEGFFEIKAFPSLIIDANSDYRFEGASVTPSHIVRDCYSSKIDNPTVVGIKANTTIDAANQITVDLETTVRVENDYKIAVALLISGYNYEQTGSNLKEDVQNHVLSVFLQEDALGESLGTLAKDEVVKKTYTYDFSVVNQLPNNLGVDNCDILVYVMNKGKDGQYYVNNSILCPLGESTDYRYEYILE